MSKPKIYVLDGMLPLRVDSREVDIVRISKEDNIIFEATERIPILTNNRIDISNYNFMGYPWIIRDVKDSLITMANKLYHMGIRHPKCFLITNIDTVDLPLYLEYGKKYILKKDLKARSMCKLVTDKQTLLDFVDFRCSLFSKKVNSKYVKDLFTNNRHDYVVSEDDCSGNINEEMEYFLDHVLKNSVGEVRNDEEIRECVEYYVNGNHNYFIQEFIDIEEEYRLVWFNTGDDSDWVILRRHSHDITNPDVPFDMKVDLVYKEEDRNTILDSLTDLDVTLRDRIKFLGASLNTFRLSIDLYKDRSGNYGILEYQTELFEHEIPRIMELNTKALIYTIDKLKAVF